MGTLFVDKLDPQSGTSLEIGSSGDTITVPSGATIDCAKWNANLGCLEAIIVDLNFGATASSTHKQNHKQC